MVLEWTLGLKRLAYSRMDLSLCSISLHIKGTCMGDSEPPDILCESCAYIIHTNLQSCMSIFSDTLHDHHISEERLRDSKLPVTGYLRTKGQESVYETCACAIHTIEEVPIVPKAKQMKFTVYCHHFFKFP